MGSKGQNSGASVRAVLALADGSIFEGKGFGAVVDDTGSGLITKGEVVFNTAMSGYQEIMTDPSYAGQMICFTTPQIGNVGCNDEDFESDKIHATGMIIRDLSPITSNFRAQYSLPDFLKKFNIGGIFGIDTRALVAHLRDVGAQMGAIGFGDNARGDYLVDVAKAEGSMLGRDYVQAVTCAAPYVWEEGSWRLGSGYQPLGSELGNAPHIVAVDCGIKRNILRLLVDAGFRVTVVPATESLSDIMRRRPDGLFLSNGPGDPAALPYVSSKVAEALGKLPIFGICLGHQILARAAGAATFKLKFGHRGGNHPVQDLRSKKVEITVQNHGFAVQTESLPANVELSHVNLNDHTVEGIVIPDAMAFSVQYHPESSPGPHDSAYLFQEFRRAVCGERRA